MKNITIQAVANYKGHSISENGAVNLSFKFAYDELVHVILINQMLNNDVIVSAKLPDEKPIKLGMFRVKQITIDGDGESVVKFNGLNDYIEVDNLNHIVTKDLFKIKMSANVEEENEGS
jgi:hypothetical protein